MMSKIVVRHVAFFRIATHRGFEIFQLMLKSDDIGLDRLLRQNIHQAAAIDIVDAGQSTVSSQNQIFIYDCRRSFRRLQTTVPVKAPVANGNIALIEPERCNRQDIYESGFSDFVSWPVLGPELHMRLLAQCRSLSLNDPHHIYSRVALVERCCAYLVDHIAENPTINALARRFNTNHNTLNTAFKREMGLPPSAWQRKMRLEGAARQLITTDLPVNVIAERFGYELPANFATAFRRHFCTSPLRYRKDGVAQNGMVEQRSFG